MQSGMCCWPESCGYSRKHIVLTHFSCSEALTSPDFWEDLALSGHRLMGKNQGMYLLPHLSNLLQIQLNPDATKTFPAFQATPNPSAHCTAPPLSLYFLLSPSSPFIILYKSGTVELHYNLCYMESDLLSVKSCFLNPNCSMHWMHNT